ncbi:MAG: hypothetical protein J6S67_05840 [Methanobrevibacter sp.]|nr:hypothetical protein [Methanobrevibacter sp.]
MGIMKKPRMNFIYNADEKLGFGAGYYFFFEGTAGDTKGKPLFETYYHTEEKNEYVDMISVGILNELRRNAELGWEYDPFYYVDLEQHFGRHE